MKGQPTLERFWSKVDKTGECWIWTGSKSVLGYGYFGFYKAGRRTQVLAHRMSLSLSGGDLADDQVVLHKCDNPSCVRPDHLTVGTQRDNIHDALRKGRLKLDGLSADTLIICRACHVEFLGWPSRRYCNDHTPRSRRKSAA